MSEMVGFRSTALEDLSPSDREAISPRSCAASYSSARRRLALPGLCRNLDICTKPLTLISNGLFCAYIKCETGGGNGAPGLCESIDGRSVSDGTGRRAESRRLHRNLSGKDQRGEV